MKTKQEVRQANARDVKAIRAQYYSGNGKPMRQAQFAELYNATEPLDLKIDAQTLCRYETAVGNIPGDKLKKLLLMDKG